MSCLFLAGKLRAKPDKVERLVEKCTWLLQGTKKLSEKVCALSNHLLVLINLFSHLSLCFFFISLKIVFFFSVHYQQIHFVFFW